MLSISEKLAILAALTDAEFPFVDDDLDGANAQQNAFNAMRAASPDFWDLNAEEFEKSARTWIEVYKNPPESFESLNARAQSVGVWLRSNDQWEPMKYAARVGGERVIRQLTEDEFRALVDERERQLAEHFLVAQLRLE